MRRIKVAIKDRGRVAIDDSMLTYIGEGRYEEFYLDEIVDGKYVVDDEASASASSIKYKAGVKSAIEKAIATTRVEVDGLGYDGDETATTRMQKAITTLVRDEEINWRLYDNSMAVVTQTELGKAMRASGVLMSKLWFCASVEEVEAIVGLDPIWLDKYKA